MGGRSGGAPDCSGAAQLCAASLRDAQLLAQRACPAPAAASESPSSAAGARLRHTAASLHGLLSALGFG